MNALDVRAEAGERREDDTVPGGDVANPDGLEELWETVNGFRHLCRNTGRKSERVLCARSGGRLLVAAQGDCYKCPCERA